MTSLHQKITKFGSRQSDCWQSLTNQKSESRSRDHSRPIRDRLLPGCRRCRKSAHTRARWNIWSRGLLRKYKTPGPGVNIFPPACDPPAVLPVLRSHLDQLTVLMMTMIIMMMTMIIIMMVIMSLPRPGRLRGGWCRPQSELRTPGHKLQWGEVTPVIIIYQLLVACLWIVYDVKTIENVTELFWWLKCIANVSVCDILWLNFVSH